MEDGVARTVPCCSSSICSSRSALPWDGAADWKRGVGAGAAEPSLAAGQLLRTQGRGRVEQRSTVRIIMGRVKVASITIWLAKSSLNGASALTRPHWCSTGPRCSLIQPAIKPISERPSSISSTQYYCCINYCSLLIPCLPCWPGPCAFHAEAPARRSSTPASSGRRERVPSALCPNLSSKAMLLWAVCSGPAGQSKRQA